MPSPLVELCDLGQVSFSVLGLFYHNIRELGQWSLGLLHSHISPSCHEKEAGVGGRGSEGAKARNKSLAIVCLPSHTACWGGVN